MPISPALLVSLIVSTILGTIGGFAFRSGNDMGAWNLFIAMFLWTLISAAGTTIARFTIERVERGNWRRGVQVSTAQSLPLMLCFALIATIFGAPMSLSTLTVLFGSTLVVALTVCILGVLTSPFR